MKGRSWSERPAVAVVKLELGLRGGPNQSRAVRWGRRQRQRAGAPGPALAGLAARWLLLLGCLSVSGKRLAGWCWLALPVRCMPARMPSRAQPVASPQFNPKNEPHFFIASHRILDNTSPPRAFSRPEVAAPARLDDSPFLFFGSSGSAL